MDDWLSRFIATERLPADFADVARAVCAPLVETILARRTGPGFVVGICGPQASGKSTLTAVLAAMLRARGLTAAVLSIDDLYLTRAERQVLSAEVHPLLATRGVPGTHDVALGEAVLEALKGRGEVALPRFDKACDDRAPLADWPVAAAPVDVVLFEGWCIGATPQDATALVQPINALERDEDPDGAWRGFANAALAGPYRRLFARIGLFVLLRPPGFEVVLGWRQEQERKLRERLAREGAGAGRAMSDVEVARFIAHYERITRHILAEAPARADVTIALDAQRRMIAPY